MNNRLKIYTTFLLSCLFATLHLATFSQSDDKCRQEALKLKAVLLTYHVSPPSFDTAFSAKVFGSFLENLDAKGFFFKPTDIKNLEAYKYSIFTRMNNPAWDFTDIVRQLYFQRLTRFDSLLHAILSRPMDLTSKETLDFDLKNNVNHSSEADIRKYLKYKILNYAFAANDSIASVSQFLKYESDARRRVLRNETAKLGKLLKKPDVLEEFVNTSFLNAIAQCADPHSEYMSLDRKTEFETELKPEVLSFGFYISSTEDDELLVDDVVPGGSAWNSKLINKGDIITGFKLPGQEKTDIADIGIDEANDVLASPENKQIEFYLRKKDGTLKVAMLVKSKINQDDVIVKGYILQGKTKIGYISLPEFYNDFENQSELGCANDVAKECIKLQKENIAGLIIDLRNNGGGSIKEAVDLSGLFIDFGPVCKLKQSDNGVSILKDFNRGIAYSGPLVIMVNGLSASASEIFAGAMQDYNRAVIVGSRTYGKATGQVIIPCDTVKETKSHGYVKVTTDKIYRITGKSNQMDGVTPDVSYGDFDLMEDYKEANEPYALTKDSIGKSNFKMLPALPLNYLVGKSRTRMSNNADFKELEILSDSVGFYTHSFKLPLDFGGFSSYNKQKKSIINHFDKLQQKTVGVFKVKPAQFDDAMSSIDSDFVKDHLDYLEKDIYIQEAFNIITDLAETTTTKP